LPYPIAIADPAAQKATSPYSTTDLASSSRSIFKGVSKYISSPHL